jgi:hypothetical protein
MQALANFITANLNNILLIVSAAFVTSLFNDWFTHGSSLTLARRNRALDHQG